MISLSNIRRAACVIVVSLLTVIPALTFAVSEYQSSQVLAQATTNPFDDPGVGGTTNTGSGGGTTNTGGGGGTTNTGSGGGTTNTGGGGGTTNTGGGSINVKIINPTSKANINNLCDFINAVLNIVAQIGAIVAVLFIIWSGFLFITAQGNKTKLDKAKSTFYTTVIGTAILLGASVITKIIVNTVGSVSSAITGHDGGGICSS
jgi:hypothetical protein